MGTGVGIAYGSWQEDEGHGIVCLLKRCFRPATGSGRHWSVCRIYDDRTRVVICGLSATYTATIIIPPLYVSHGCHVLRLRQVSLTGRWSTQHPLGSVQTVSGAHNIHTSVSKACTKQDSSKADTAMTSTFISVTSIFSPVTSTLSSTFTTVTSASSCSLLTLNLTYLKDVSI